MSGERDLSRLLSGLAPALEAAPRVFARLDGEPADIALFDRSSVTPPSSTRSAFA